MKGPAPVRFLAVVVGCWIAVRVVVWLPEWIPAPAAERVARAPVPAHAGPPVLPSVRPREAPRHQATLARARLSWPLAASGTRIAAGGPPPLVPVPTETRRPLAPVPAVLPAPSPPAIAPRPAPHAVSPLLPPLSVTGTAPRQDKASRWSASAWLFLREGGSGLAPGGTLGGSQTGGRLRYRVNEDPRRPLAISGRVYLPLERAQGAEVALGIDWKPVAALPFHLLVERRERIGREGRSDFSATVYGGGERRVLGGRVRLEAYGQAGAVGLEEQDLFADGAVRASIPVGPVEIGAGAWGGAQPGASRLDAGPLISTRVPLGDGTLRASAEWRFRVAGEAAPASGPALTIAAEF
jgi:hypothetical protein